MDVERSSGILLHMTSLPGPFGMGDLGPEAVAFLDLLARARQGWWQILPMGPVGGWNSPYQSSSSFAGNPAWISPERLVEAGLLSRAALRKRPSFPAERVDYPNATALRMRWLREAHRAFGPGDGDFARFQRVHAGWLDDYALFEALRSAFEGSPWWTWPEPLRIRKPKALRQWSKQLGSEIAFHRFVQYVFDQQWKALREQAAARGVSLIGDVPIFVSHDSADVWARPDLFQLDEMGQPTVVAGVPPDYFSADGQLWGNPLYHWPAHAEEGYAWWKERLRVQLDRVDLVRLDHFRGFEDYWEVPAHARTAATGRWVEGPGDAFFQAMTNALGSLPIIAEDLGEITPDVIELRDRWGLPGMRVLQFAFEGNSQNPHLPHNYSRHCVVYTGTHDNDTTVGWFQTRGSGRVAQSMLRQRRAAVRRYLATSGHEIHWDLIRAAQASVAELAVVPLQDVLGLGSEARMNVPGRAEGNWSWRCASAQLDDRRPFERLAELTELYGRSQARSRSV